jgi:site-specific DNA-methyltransferase (adenine-specific)
MIYYTDDNATLIHADVLDPCLVKPETVDLIVTSPPYNLDIPYGSTQDNVSYDDYLYFNFQWLHNALRWLKPDGRMCLNIPIDKNKGGQVSVGADFTQLVKQVGFHYRSTIIWHDAHISRRTAWGSWMSASAPYVIAPAEIILVVSKSAQWKRTSGSKINDITRDEFMAWTNGMWAFRGESKKRLGHPAPFPVELPRRCIKLFSYVGDVVLDPFSCSGSTVVAAVGNKRKGIGIDIDADNCQLARSRVTNIFSALQVSNETISIPTSLYTCYEESDAQRPGTMG